MSLRASVAVGDTDVPVARRRKMKGGASLPLVSRAEICRAAKVWAQKSLIAGVVEGGQYSDSTGGRTMGQAPRVHSPQPAVAPSRLITARPAAAKAEPSAPASMPDPQEEEAVPRVWRFAHISARHWHASPQVLIVEQAALVIAPYLQSFFRRPVCVAVRWPSAALLALPS